jgi:class 3 adenylate cyclase
MFIDIEDSIRLWEADREAMAEASVRYDRIVREQIEIAGGHVETVGEAFRAVFGDPFAALASGVAIQRVAGTEPWPAGLPIGCAWRCIRAPAWSVMVTMSVRW